MTQGVGPLDSDIRVPTLAGDAFISSQARALLENLTASRGDPVERRTLGTTGVEAWLDRFISRDVSGAVNQIRDTARDDAKPLGSKAVEISRCLDNPTLWPVAGLRHRLTSRSR